MIRSYNLSLKDAEISIEIDSKLPEFNGLAAAAMLIGTTMFHMLENKKMSKKEKSAFSAYLHGVGKMASIL